MADRRPSEDIAGIKLAVLKFNAKRMKHLINEIARCVVCAQNMPHSPRPVVAASENSRILIIGQAPGARVHESGVPWDDKSGDNLRDWLGFTNEQFYDPSIVAIVPMGFCYPGKGTSGDLPPRTECAPLWHERILNQLTNVKLTLLIGSYAQEYYLQQRRPRLR